ncbi:hypothetical protein [Amnibacterium setariae]|uniref:hypothetical protein n=1 Tax=Amnibacterium setariae TaxID=2306585 RepID=UPI0013145DDF|nr:hypothetical protein [Amnibacterium setariae]
MTSAPAADATGPDDERGAPPPPPAPPAEEEAGRADVAGAPALQRRDDHEDVTA